MSAQDRPVGRLRVVEAPRFSALPHAVLTDERLTNGEVVLYAALQMHWWQGGECWASHATLARTARCSERQVQRYLRRLVSLGYITERRRGQGQAKAYAPVQHDTGVAFNTTPTSSLPSNTTPVSEQHDTHVAFNTTPVSDRRRHSEEDSLKEEDTGVIAAADAAQAERGKPKRRASRLADDATLTADHLEAAVSIGLSPATAESEWAQFADYHRAKGSTMSDWLAAWRTWCRNSLKFGARQSGQYGASARTSQKPTTAAHAQQPTRLPAKNVRTY